MTKLTCSALLPLSLCWHARAMCAAYPYHVAAEDVAELIASDAGDPEYLVRKWLWPRPSIVSRRLQYTCKQ